MLQAEPDKNMNNCERIDSLHAYHRWSTCMWETGITIHRNSRNFKNFTHTYSQFLVQSPTLYRKLITIHDRSQLFTHQQRVDKILCHAADTNTTCIVVISKSTFLEVFKYAIHIRRYRNLHRWNTLNKRLKKKVWINKLWNHFYKRRFSEF